MRRSIAASRAGLLLLLAASTAQAQTDVDWQYPQEGLTFNYNDVIVASWQSMYAHPVFYVWAPNADGSAVIEYMSTTTIWTNASFAYTFSSSRGGRTTYPFTAHFQIQNGSTPPTAVDSPAFTITSTSGAPTTYAYQSTTTLTQLSAAPTNTAGPQSVSAFTYVGCWTDAPYDRTLQNFFKDDDLGGNENMTIQNCYLACTATDAAEEAGFSIFGVEWGNQCFCDSTIWNPAAYALPERECDTPCAGDSGTTCGGFNRLNMYAISASLPAWTASVSPSVTSTAGASPTGASTSNSPLATTPASTTSSSTLPSSLSSTASPTSSPLSITWTTGSHSSLSVGARVGIAIGVAAACLLLILFLILYLRRRRRTRQQQTHQQYTAAPTSEPYSADAETVEAKKEGRLLYGDGRDGEGEGDMGIERVGGGRAEMEGRGVAELSGEGTVGELEAGSWRGGGVGGKRA